MSTPCKIWPWGLDKEGYAISTHHYRQTRVAKVVLEDFLGRPLLKGELTRHLCHNKACVEVSHLVPGNAKDNFLDNYKSGKRMLQEKLTDADVRLIRKLKGKHTYAVIATMFSLSTSMVSDIINKKKKSHIPDEGEL